MKESTLVRENLMTIKGYSPYCGGWDCYCNPRTHFNGEQFKCNCCGWISKFSKEFINRYKKKWGIN